MFDSANRLYDEGKYTAAASSYEKLVEAGVMSPALYFQFGKFVFKSGQIGRAIAAYRKAEQMSPRDPDVQGNLQFARNQVQGPTMRPTRAQKALGKLSMNEWTLVTMDRRLVSLLLLATMQWRPGWRVSLRGLTAAVIAATVVWRSA
jgi:tetratricopeptide (TPR) repeat protein